MIFEELNLTQRIAKNTTYAILGNIAFRLINFFVVLFLARYLGRDLFGLYGFIFAYLTIFDAIIEFGITHILVRDISRDEDNAALLLGNAFILRLVVVFVCLFASWFAAYLLRYPIDIRFLLFIASFEFFLQLRSIFEVIFRVRLKLQFPALETIIRAATYGIFVIIAIALKLSLLSIIVFNIISGVIGLFFLIPCSLRYLKLKLRINLSFIKYILKQSFPLMLSNVFILMYYRIDVILLSKMKNFTDIGYYTTSTRLIEALTIFPLTIVISVFPVISETFKADREIFKKICAKVFIFIFSLSLPICFLISLFSGKIVSILYGREYLASALSLKILIWADFFIFLMFLSSQMLIAIGKQHIDTLTSLIMIITNIILDILLIPKYSFIGCSIAVLLSVAVGGFLELFYLLKTVHFRLPLGIVNKIVFINLIFLALFFVIWKTKILFVFIYLLVYVFVYYLFLRKIKILPVDFSFR